MEHASDISVIFWLLLIASVVAMLGHRFRIPYTAALVVTGFIIGIPHLLPQAHLDPHLLFTVLLPPLLFEAAINVNVARLRERWRPITIYALAGTLLSAVIVGSLVAWLLHVPLMVGLVFGALIAPTDPISVIAIFKRLGVDKRLALMVEGESLFNDGVGVVLFTVFVGIVMGDGMTVGDGILRFIATVVGGGAVGLGIGFLASRVTREFDDRLLEIMLTTIVAYGAYLLAEAVHVSGVIAVVAAGLAVGSYGMRTGMSATTRLSVLTFWEYAAFAVNSLVFLLIGIDEARIVNFWESTGVVALVIAIVLLGRAVAVYALAPFSGRGEQRVPLNWQHVLFWGGLRGALSMALALGLAQSFPHRETILMLTFSVVLFSLLVQGLTMSPLLRRLGLVQGDALLQRYQRLVGALLGVRAALAEVRQLAETHYFPASSLESVAATYREKHTRIEQDIETLLAEDSTLCEHYAAEAERLALLAEKSALQDAERAGILDEEGHRDLATPIDEALGRQPSHESY